MTPTATDIDMLAPWAVRYALGRRTYAVSDVCRTLTIRRDCLRPKTRAAIVADIDRAAATNAMGDDMDARQWQALREALR